MPKRFKILIILLAISLCINLFCNCFSPLYRMEGNLDPAAFYMEGRAWAHNLLPYKDFIDVKGIFLFFIYLIGYLLTPDRTWGILFIYTLCTFIFSIYIYKISRLFKFNNYVSVIVVLLCLIIAYNQRTAYWGAQPEILINAFLSWGLYYCVKCIENKSFDHVNTVKAALSVGLGCSAVFLIKYNAVFIYMAFFLITLILLVKNTQKKQLIISYIGTTAISFSLFCAPFLLYMYHVDIFDDFIYNYFLRNVNLYTSDNGYYNSIFQLIYNKIKLIGKGDGLIPTIITLVALARYIHTFINNKTTIKNTLYTFLILSFYFTCFIGNWGYYFILFSSIIAIPIVKYIANTKNNLIIKITTLTSAKHQYIVTLFLLVTCILFNLHFANDRGLFRDDISRLNTIEKHLATIPSPKIMYFDTADWGAGLKATPLPACAAWSAFPNLNLREEQENAIKNNIPDFILSSDTHNHFLVKCGYHKLPESERRGIFLYKRLVDN